MTIAAILSGKGREVISIAPTATVMEAAAMLAERRIGAVPVVEDDAVVGIFSERDVIHALNTGGVEALQGLVRTAMTSPPITVAPQDSVLGALSLMSRRRIRHLPVLDGGALTGFVSIGDLVKYRIDRIEADAAAMRDYIQSV